MKLCAISFKECWCNENGQWFSDGGFPLQMNAIGSLFDEMILLITQVNPRPGGIPLPAYARIIPLRHPVGHDARRKLSIFLNLPYYLKELIKYIRTADVVHTPLPGDIPLLGMLVGLTLRKPLLARYGGSWHDNACTTFMDRVTKTLMRRFAGRKNVMLATGDSPQPPAPNVHWIFVTAISRVELNNTTLTLNRGLSSPPRLAYVGRLSPEKGVAVLIETLGILNKQGLKNMPKIILIGDGKQRTELEKRISDHKLDSFFVFKGQLDRQSLSVELTQVDFCIQPSLTEGFSKAWLDAFAHGLPILATDVGSAFCVIGKNGERGWIVPPNDVTALSEMLHQILTDNGIDWSSLRQRCRKYSEELTLENWKQKIGVICAKQWGLSLVEGKLRR